METFCIAAMDEGLKIIFRAHGGTMRMSEAINQGISRYMLYRLRDNGVVEQIGRGLYRLTELPPIGNPDLVIVGLRYPNAVICLISALAYHELTTQIPRKVYIAIARDARPPQLHYPPLSVHRFSGDAFETGIEVASIDGVSVKIYNQEKTLADCFKYRNKLGMDIVLEALKLYHTRKTPRLDSLMKYAKICRVENVMRPYVETLF